MPLTQRWRALCTTEMCATEMEGFDIHLNGPRGETDWDSADAVIRRKLRGAKNACMKLATVPLSDSDPLFDLALLGRDLGCCLPKASWTMP